MKSPLRYCARKDKTEAGSTSFSVKFDETTGILTYLNETKLHGRDETTWHSYKVKLSDLEPSLIRFTPVSSDSIWWMNLICRDYRDLVSVERKFSSSTHVNKTQCYFPLPIKRPLLARPNFTEEFQEWIRSHLTDNPAAATRLDADTVQGITSLLELANGVLIPSNSGNREFTQEVDFLPNELVIERQMATAQKFHGRWRFPIMALDSEPPLVDHIDGLALLKLNSIFPLEECEWFMGYGEPTIQKQMTIMFRSESEASEFGQLLHSAVTQFRAEPPKP